jgi:acyl-CoA thioester hydrolase
MVKHVEKIRVRWVDTDASGRIHYTAAFRYFEIAEWELFRRLGISPHSEEESLSLPRVDVQATFHAMLSVDDEIAVHIEVARLGNSSVSFSFAAYKEKGDVRCISGKITSVFIGKDGRPIPIPDRVRRALALEVQ